MNPGLAGRRPGQPPRRPGRIPDAHRDPGIRTGREQERERERKRETDPDHLLHPCHREEVRWDDAAASR
jgi:hypothetical protein